MKKKIILGALSVLLAGTVAVGAAACKDNSKHQAVEVDGQSTTLVTTAAPTELTPYEVAYAFIQKQSELDSYIITTNGTAVANLLGYKQDIYNTTYKNGDDYLDAAQSDSALVHLKHQAFAKGDQVVYRSDFKGDLSVATKSEYKAVYGLSPDDVAIGGFIFNAKTVRYAELLSTPDVADALTYHYVLNGDLSVEAGTATESATSYVRIQSMAYGGLEYVPSFSDVEFYLTIKEDWTPVQYRTSCSYDFKKMSMNMHCEQDLTCVYSSVNEKVDIPDVEAFNAKIGSTPSEVVPVETEQTVLMDIVDAFTALDFENGVKLGLELKVGMLEAYNLAYADRPLSADIYAKYNPEAIENGTYLDVVNLRIDADPYHLLPLYNLILNFIDTSEMPFLSSVSGLSLCYAGDGYPVLVLTNNAGNPVYTQKIDLVNLLLPLLTDGTLSGLTGGDASSALDGLDLMGILGELDSAFTVTETETGRKLTLGNEAVAVIDAAYQSLLATLGESLDSTLASVLNSALRANIEGLTVDLIEENGVIHAIELNLLGTSSKIGNTSSLLSLKLTLDSMTESERADLLDDAEELAALAANDEIAAGYRAQVDYLVEHMWLGNSYVTRVNTLYNEIQGLAPEICSLVWNANSLPAMIETHNALKAGADAFLAGIPEDWNGDWESLENYNGLEACQKEYVKAKLEEN